MCTDHTQGVHCDTCSPGYYGDPTRGTPEDCKPCACPLTEKSNNFATSCVLKPTFADPDAFQCLDCARGYAGERCERYVNHNRRKYTTVSCQPRWLMWKKVRLVIRRLFVQPPPGWQHSFMEIFHEIFCMVILSLPLIQEGQLSVSGKRMCTIMEKAYPVKALLGKLTALVMTPLG